MDPTHSNLQGGAPTLKYSSTLVQWRQVDDDQSTVYIACLSVTGDNMWEQHMQFIAFPFAPSAAN